ncbi:MAG: toxin-antitoxin system YwqK family antitoxin [Pseudomonadota bacterium]
MNARNVSVFGWASLGLLCCLTAFAGMRGSGAGPVVATPSQVTISPETGLRLWRGRPLTGEVQAFHDNGTLARVEPFVDGRREGRMRIWFPDGALAYSSIHRGGRRHGVTTSWWPNGRMRSQTTYVDDQPHGIAQSWYRGGERFKRLSYAMGQPVGVQQGWRTNGKLFSNFEYRDGRAYGLRNASLCVELEDENIMLSPYDDL